MQQAKQALCAEVLPISRRVGGAGRLRMLLGGPPHQPRPWRRSTAPTPSASQGSSEWAEAALRQQQRQGQPQMALQLLACPLACPLAYPLAYPLACPLACPLAYPLACPLAYPLACLLACPPASELHRLHTVRHRGRPHRLLLLPLLLLLQGWLLQPWGSPPRPPHRACPWRQA